jgi:hypothetical protein
MNEKNKYEVRKEMKKEKKELRGKGTAQEKPRAGAPRLRRFPSTQQPIPSGFSPRAFSRGLAPLRRLGYSRRRRPTLDAEVCVAPIAGNKQPPGIPPLFFPSCC